MNTDTSDERLSAFYPRLTRCLAALCLLYAWPAPVHGQAPPLGAKADFIRNYQGNFGGIKVPDCKFHNDVMFDPVVLW